MPEQSSPFLPSHPDRDLAANPASLRAVLWDMDGTIVDTEPYWIQAEHELVQSWGGTWSHDQALQLVGSALERSAAILQQAGVGLSVPEIIAVLTEKVIERTQEHIPWRPGAVELLTELHQAGVPTALVTMSFPQLADLINGELGVNGFETVVTGDQVERGKPDPQAYNLAFERLAQKHLGLERHQVVALEDSVPGVSSAVDAGLVTIAIPHTVALPSELGDVHWDTLKGKHVPDLQHVLEQHRHRVSAGQLSGE